MHWRWTALLELEPAERQGEAIDHIGVEILFLGSLSNKDVMAFYDGPLGPELYLADCFKIETWRRRRCLD